MRQLQGSINARQQELHNVTDILASAAERFGRGAVVAKGIVIVLGALVATRQAVDQVSGPGNSAVALTYALLGVAIAAAGGLEAAFRLERRSAELGALAATSQSTLREVDTQWETEIGIKPLGEQVTAAQRLLKRQDERLEQVQSKAAALGVNITLAVRQLDAEERPYLA